MWSMQLVAPRRFQERTVRRPRPTDLQAGDVLVRMILGGICGSDVRGYRTANRLDGSPAAPGFPMHELVGEVVASQDPDLRPGEIVVGWATSSDALAELVTTRGDSLAVIGSDRDPQVALVAQPLACVLSALDRVGPVAGARTAVIGQGAIGLLFAHVLRARGAASVVGVDPVARSGSPQDFGVDEHIAAPAEDWAATVGPESAPDVIVEAVGHQTSTLGAAVAAAAPWGRILYFGIPHLGSYPLDMTRLLRQQLTLLAGTTARDRRRYLDEALAYLDEHDGLAQTLVTDVVGLDDVGEAYELMAGATPGHAKVVVRFDR